MIGMFVVSGLLLCVLAIPMILKKVKPNFWYGFRVRKTLENPDIWYAVIVQGFFCKSGLSPRKQRATL
jgi:hypothetical protein